MSSRYDYSAPFGQRAAVSLADPQLRSAVADASDRQIANRLRAMRTLEDPEAMRDLGSRIRDAVLSRLDEHLERLADNWEAAGGRVFFAADASDAATYVTSLAQKAGGGIVVKSKSMASEEIALNSALESAGIEAVETDLGEYIVQLGGDHPSHIITPAIHKSKRDVARILSEVAGRELPDDASELTRFARGELRARFLSASVGVSGVNFGISEAGAICLVTNEGNGRMCTSVPPVHVAIMGMERVVGTFDELAVMLSLLARSATGQKLTQYTSIISGPRRADELDGPEEAHLVILDNGRSSMLGTRYQDILKCIRCGACLNVCPVYRQVGGHAYDPTYSGPIGAVLNPIIKGGAARELAHASTLCGACTEVCPVRIPLHDILLHLRQEYAPDAAIAERAVFSAWSRAWATRRRFRLFSGVTSLLGRLVGGSGRRGAPVPVMGRWMRGRTYPGRARWRARRGRW